MIVLGVLGAVICMQAIRYRTEAEASAAALAPERPRVRPLTWLAAIVTARHRISVMIALDGNGRHGETRDQRVSRRVDTHDLS